ncbi:MAG: hypothetical protein PHY59_02205 [Methanobacterium sp.]|nr:hypothetical protein [Methanobacterium sp.]
MFRLEYGNGKYNIFKITKNNFRSIINKSKNINGHITVNNNLSIATLIINNAFTIKPTKEALEFIVNNDVVIKDSLEIFVENRRSHEIVYFTQLGNNLYKLEWEYFLDKGSTYVFKVKLKEMPILFEKTFIRNFRDISFKNKNINIKIFKTNNGHISLKG